MNSETAALCHYDSIVRAKMAALHGESFLRFPLPGASRLASELVVIDEFGYARSVQLRGA